MADRADHVGLIGEAAILCERCERRFRSEDGADRAMRPLQEAVGRGRHTVDLPEATAHRACREPMPVGPLAQIQCLILAEVVREDVGPVRQGNRLGLDLLADGIFRSRRIVFENVDYGIEIRESTGCTGESPGLHGDDEHLGAAPIEMIEVKLIGSMNERISRLGTMPPGIAGFHIAAGQDDGRERFLVNVAGEEITCTVALPALRWRAHPAARRISFKTWHFREFTIQSMSEAIPPCCRPGHSGIHMRLTLATRLPLIPFILLVCCLPAIADATGKRVEAILRANQLAVGQLPRAGAATYRYGYSGNGLTGEETRVADLATGAYTERVDSGVLHTADGFDTRTPWMRDISGANTPQGGGDRVRIAVSAAYRYANLWWRSDRAGARIEDLGRESLSDTSTDHLSVQPPDGVPFDAWFDTHTHLLLQIAEPQEFLHAREVFSHYRREGGVMLAHSILEDAGTGEAGYERLTLRSVSFGPPQPLAIFACPRNPPTGVTLAQEATSMSVPFRLLNNHIYVEGRVNGKGPYTFIVDTGGHTLLSARVIAEAGLARRGNSPESGAGEKQSSLSFVPVRTISIGGVEMHDQVAFAAEIYRPEIEGIAVDGMVGFELFRRLVVRVDYGRKVLTFTEPGHASLSDAGVGVPFVFYDHVPFVRGRLDGISATFDIDTGSRSELDVTSPAAVRDHLWERYPQGIRAVTGWGVGGEVSSYVVRVRSITLGTVTVDAPVADLSEAKHGSFSDPNYDGNVGSALLKRFVVTFDYGNRMMYLRRIEPVPPDVGDFDRSGLWINAGKAGYRVTSVAPGSPAAEAGLQPGDLIIELDGRRAKAEDLSEARELLRARSAGSSVPMLVRGKAATRRVVLTLRDLI